MATEAMQADAMLDLMRLAKVVSPRPRATRAVADVLEDGSWTVVLLDADTGAALLWVHPEQFLSMRNEARATEPPMTMEQLMESLGVR